MTNFELRVQRLLKSKIGKQHTAARIAARQRYLAAGHDLKNDSPNHWAIRYYGSVYMRDDCA